jgi:hypothetical protein
VTDRSSLFIETHCCKKLLQFLTLLSLLAICTMCSKPRRRGRELKMIVANVENLPLRNLVLFSQNRISFQLLDSIILVMNGMFSQGLLALLFGRRTKLQKREEASELNLP